jgi:hypothetical protein
MINNLLRTKRVASPVKFCQLTFLVGQSTEDLKRVQCNGRNGLCAGSLDSNSEARRVVRC